MNITTPLKPRVIFLNGPPQCGKDTVGDIIAERCNHVSLLKFAQPLIDGMRAMFGVSCADGRDKEVACSELMGMTRRECAISLSEDWFKEQFGEQVFGKIALDRISKDIDSSTIVMTDSGFHCEAVPILQNFLPKSLEIVKMSRPGCNFDNDSRSYWSDERTIKRRLYNDGTLDDLERQVESLLDTWSL